MNERIRELAEQAENYAHEQNDKFGLSYKREYDKKFAELIVRECILLFDGSKETKTAGLISHNQVVSQIKEHFGFEE